MVLWKCMTLLFFSLYIQINPLITNNNVNDDIIDISSNYTHVKPDDKLLSYIPIIGTTDLHGHFYSEYLNNSKINYTRGGLDYLGKYLNIIREEFSDRVLFLDAGDLFNGGTESTISNGEIMMDFMNYAKCDGMTFGNHEYGVSRDFLEDKVNKSKCPYLATNIFDNKKKTKNAFGDNHLTSKIYTFKVNRNESSSDNEIYEIKIGVIGLSKEMTKKNLAGKGFDDISFLSYKNELTNEAKKLREQDGCDAIILLSHIGVYCGETDLKLNMYKYTDKDKCDTDQDLYKLLMSLDKNVIDGVVTGHNHKDVHHWINDIPVIATIDKGLYANILYIAFQYNSSKKKYILAPKKVQIEGPIPICEKVFQKNGKCDYIKESQIDDYLSLVEYKFHGVKIEKDPSINPIHEKYDKDYDIYKEKICDIIGTEDIMEVELNGDFYIGNIYADIQSRITGADISIINYSYLKTYWIPGALPRYQVRGMIPFDNKLCTFKMYGREVKRMMSILQTGSRKYYPTYGVKQIMNKNQNGDYYLCDIKLFDGYKESEIILDKEYLITTTDYLIVQGGSDFSNILKWYEPRELNCDYGDIEQLTESYLKAQKIVDVRKYKDEKNPKIIFLNN